MNSTNGNGNSGGRPSSPSVTTPAPGAPAKFAQRPRRPRWTGLSTIVLFVCLFALLAYGLDAAINFGLRQIRTSKFGALNEFMEGRANADIVISGSSRALSHYDPRVIQNVTGHTAFDIGMNSSQTDFEVAILKTYLAHNTKPKLVVHNLDMSTFVTTKKGDLYDPGYFMPYLGDTNLYSFIRQIEPDAWKCRCLPLYGYAVEDMNFTWVSGLLGCVGVQQRNDYYRGFNPRPPVWNDDFQRFKAEHSAGTSWPIEPDAINDLRNLIGVCRRENVPLVLVFSPEYYEMQALATNRSEIIGKFQEIASQYNVPFWDYSASPLSRDQSKFNNSEHLNIDGAEAFSTDLSGRLLELLQAQAAIPGKSLTVARLEGKR